MTPVVFGQAGKQLAGIYHAAEPAGAIGAGVVLCNPLGYEAMCAHRTYRHLAERLSSAGFDVLRFDYDGTGDSSGGEDHPDRLRAWIESIGAAVDELRAIAGVTSVDLFGVRFGATLAVLAASERRDIRGLVLWAPVVSGRAYVRELRALSMLKGGREPLELGAAAEQGRDGSDSVESATLRDLSAVNLLAQRVRVAERALVVPRDDLPTREERLVSHLRECGVETELRADPGYARMMDHPESALVPSVMLDAIVAWLRRSGTTVRRRPALPAGPGVLAAWSHAPRRAVLEQALSFGEAGRLFGILTENSQSGSGRTAVVFLNAGANHRVGPNRLYVSLARDLAARGYPAFRFDVGGLGDGAPAPGRTENEIYSKESVVDVKAALTFLTRIRGVERFVLVGICSGGFLAFHTTAEDARVKGQVVINPQTFEWKKGDSLALSVKKNYKSTRYYLTLLWRPTIWSMALRGQLDLRGVADVLRSRSIARAAGRLKRLVARWWDRDGASNEVERVFQAVSARGVRSLLIFSSNDGGLDMIEQHMGSGASSMQGHANFRLEIFDGADHTFGQSEAQQRLRTLILRFVETSWPEESSSLGRARVQLADVGPCDSGPDVKDLHAASS